MTFSRGGLFPNRVLAPTPMRLSPTSSASFDYLDCLHSRTLCAQQFNLRTLKTKLRFPLVSSPGTKKRRLCRCSIPSSSNLSLLKQQRKICAVKFFALPMAAPTERSRWQENFSTNNPGRILSATTLYVALFTFLSAASSMPGMSLSIRCRRPQPAFYSSWTRISFCTSQPRCGTCWRV